MAPLPEARDRIDWALTHALRAALLSSRGAAVPSLHLEEEIASAVLEEAGLARLDGLVSQGLVALGNAPLAGEAAKRRRQGAVLSLWLHEHRRRVSAALDAREIPHVYLKGALSDALHWRGSGLRGTSDLDVLVAAGDADHAVQALSVLDARELDFSRYRVSVGLGHARVLSLPTAGDLIVDLHTSLISEPPFRDPSEEVLQRAVVYRTAVGDIRGPEREDALLFAAANLASDGFSGRAKLALDAACLLDEGGLRSDVVLARASEWGCAAAVWALLRIVEVRLGGRPDPSLMSALRPASRRRRALLEALAGVHTAPLRLRGEPTRALFAPSSSSALASLLRWGSLRVLDELARVPAFERPLAVFISTRRASRAAPARTRRARGRSSARGPSRSAAPDPGERPACS